MGKRARALTLQDQDFLRTADEIKIGVCLLL
jgi:hypothetical protein